MQNPSTLYKYCRKTRMNSWLTRYIIVTSSSVSIQLVTGMYGVPFETEIAKKSTQQKTPPYPFAAYQSVSDC